MRYIASVIQYVSTRTSQTDSIASSPSHIRAYTTLIENFSLSRHQKKKAVIFPCQVPPVTMYLPINVSFPIRKPVIPMLSPGLSYLLRLLPVFVLYPLLTFTALRYVSQRSQYSIPISLQAVLSILSLPATFFVSQTLTGIRNTLRARSIGAVIPPQVRDSSFGVVAKLRRMVTDYPSG